jgi:hypothetical protein
MDKDAKPMRERSGQVEISITDGDGFNWVRRHMHKVQGSYGWRVSFSPSQCARFFE